MSIRVAVRVRPFLAREKDDFSCVMTQKDEVVLSRGELANSFKFDAVYDEHSNNDEIFSKEIQIPIERAVQGFNTTIFAYGITSAGKTHTMQGNKNDPGVIPRVAREIFKILGQNGADAEDWSVNMSYLEIYNEKVCDLLDTKNVDLPIREDMQRNIFVPQLKQVSLKTHADFELWYDAGCNNRRSAPTALNNQSSRSHAILTLSIRRGQKKNGSQSFSFGKLHLIDLAGSEDNRLTTNTGVRMMESSSINTSLFVLGQVVDALRNQNQHQNQRVPYRDSKLTRFLQDSLGGSAFGVMIANIAPGAQKAHETFRTLNFASKSREVVNNPVQNIVQIPNSTLPTTTSSSSQRGALKPLGISGSAPAVRTLLKSASFLSDDVLNKLNSKVENTQISRAFVHAAPSASAPPSALNAQSNLSLLTPLTHSRAVEQIREKAAAFESAGEYGKALNIYKGALALVGDDNPFVLKRIEILQGMIEKENAKNQPPPPPAAAPIVAVKKPMVEEESDDSFEPNPDDEEPGTIKQKKKTTKKTAAKRERSEKSGSGGSHLKKVKSPLADVQVSEAVLQRLLELINNASAAELMQLQCVGKKRADAIVDYRKKSKFESIQQLSEVGFGKKTLDSFMKRNIFVE